MTTSSVVNLTSSLVVYDGLEILAGSSLDVLPQDRVNVSNDPKFLVDINDPLKDVLVTDTRYPSIDFTGQDAIDLLRGHYHPSITSTPSPTTTEKEIVLISDTRQSGQDGGTTLSDRWNVRTLNKIDYEGSSNPLRLVGDDFILAKGSYEISIEAVAEKVGSHKLRVWEETSNTLIAEGISQHSDGDSIAKLKCMLVSDGTQKFEIQHYTEKRNKRSGFGKASKVGLVEVYLTAYLQRIK